MKKLSAIIIAMALLLGMASAVGIVLLLLVFGVNLIQLILMGFFRKED